MDDLFTFAAYVIIILIIGAVSIIKKIIEAQKRRSELRSRQGKTLRVEEKVAEHFPARPLITETDIPPEEEEIHEAPINIEDLLKRVFTGEITEEKPETVRRIRDFPKVELPPPTREKFTPQIKASTPPSDELKEMEGWGDVAETNWHQFTTQLKSKGLSEIQQAIIISDLIRPRPRGRR
ncbi:MAG: hypothetical protein QME51_06890 [Planctomycetota bacterium]|nr:hypothetical protein [Planctomycetota bacterium]MDI6788079.1 hypothetical protein [Planctomycetota bacterium]